MGVIGYLRTKVALRTRLRRGLKSWRELQPLREYGFMGRGNPKRTLSNVTFYGTNLCDSRCKHCGIWEQRPVLYLPLEVYHQIHDSPSTDKNTMFGFEGGEFTLLKNADEILEIFKDRPRELYSNCLKPQKTIEMCRRHDIPHLIISLDGRREAYKTIRGVDGYHKVVEVAEAMCNERSVSISYTITPWNDLDDFKFVRDFCGERGITFGVNILHSSVFFESDFKFKDIPEESDNPFHTQLNGIPFADPENLPNESIAKTHYFLGYNRWLKNEEYIPCTSIFHRIVIYPNGDVPLCQQGTTGILGNVTRQKLEDIWWAAQTLQHQKAHIKCNKCWMSYHRYHDLLAYDDMKNVVPEKMIRWWMKRKQHSDTSINGSQPTANPANDTCGM